MAFIRKRGTVFYLVHNVRDRGRVRQLHLACLGRRPRLSDQLIDGVMSKHPFLRVDWERLRTRTTRELAPPLKTGRHLRDLLSAIRAVHWDIAELHLPVLGLLPDRELHSELVSELRLLRGTLDVKLNRFRKERLLPLPAYGRK